MNNKKLLTSIALIMMIILSLLGGYIRTREMALAYDASGLLIPWHPISIMLIVLSVATCAVLAAICRYAVNSGEGSYFDYFSHSKLLAVVIIVSALLLLLASLLKLAELWGTQGAGFSLFVYCFAVLTSVCVIFQGLIGLSGRTSQMSPFLSVAPVFYCCFRMVLLFRGWSTDPAILDYIYKLISVIMLTLTFYCACGFFFGQPRVRRTAAYSMLGFYFSVIALFEGGTLADILTYQFSAIYMLCLVTQIILKQNSEGMQITDNR